MSAESTTVFRVQQQFQVSYDYPVLFCSGAFSLENPVLAELLAPLVSPNLKVLAVVDRNVDSHHRDWWQQLRAYLRHHQCGQLLPPLLFAGGESAKQNPHYIDDFYQCVADQQIDRHSVVLAIGGGAMLDAVGFGAATAHRGIHLIRMPTTVLAQNDAGVGVKNGINFRGRKNFVGCFAPPLAVLNDFQFLSSLETRDQRAGIAEAVKVALIRDGDFFEQLFEQRHRLAQFQSLPMQAMIRRCAELHLQHIGQSGDPFERGSARPLDFGHWAAHKFEELSEHRLRHGEAVAIGIALDSLYSQRCGMLSEPSLQAIILLLQDLGFSLADPVLATLDVASALAEFQQHLGGEQCITLLEAIGRGREVHHIDIEMMQGCVETLLTLQPSHEQQQRSIA